ncbi:MAG: 4Fe-4S binding protein [Proteobacteria bacterium]|nr:4Fe-4S binding protein [Pseudomonadota bacterium]
MQSCIYCGACGARCPQNALHADSDFRIDFNVCVSCLTCVMHKCPAVESLTKKGK